MSSLKYENLGCIAVARNRFDKNNNDVEFQTAVKEYPEKWTKNLVTYSLLRGTDDIPENSKERIAMNLAMTTWDFEIPLTLQVVSKFDNPDIKITFRNEELDSFFKDNPHALAYAYFPKTANAGIIVFNDEYLWSLNGKTVVVEGTSIRTYNLIHTMIHEIGHSLGLVHSNSQEDIMYSQYTGSLDLAPNDIKRITEKYGNAMWDKPQHYERLKNWLKFRVRRFEEEEFKTIEAQSQINQLKERIAELEQVVAEKDKMLMEQLKTIMNLYKENKNMKR